MSLFTWIKEKLGFDEEDFDDIEISIGSDNAESLMQSLANVSKRRRNLNMNDRLQRDQYVREYCDMMQIASKDVEAQKIEYQHVTERLADLDEIDKLPMTDRSQVKLRAKKIMQIEAEDASYTRPAKKITEAQYREMERLSDEIPDVIKKMVEDEKYQMMVRRDLNLLEGEKGAIAYARKENRNKIKNSKTWAFIIAFGCFMAYVLLFVINKAMGIDVYTFVLVVTAILALGLTGTCVSFQNAQQDVTKANKKLNKAIGLQNTVKIKYVNITNVLDYNYAKYGVMNAYELQYLWDKYNEEKNARRRDSDISVRLEDARGELYHLLKHYHINDPSVWVYQPGVLVHDDEEKDIRKSLIVQRQRLKKGIDFEMYNLDSAKKEIQSMVKQYPQYANEIIAVVDEYE